MRRKFIFALVGQYRHGNHSYRTWQGHDPSSVTTSGDPVSPMVRHWFYGFLDGFDFISPIIFAVRRNSGKE
jgi:hypothetical protein